VGAPARASIYNITGTGDLSVFSATITTSDIADLSFPGGYDITGITGSVAGFGPIVGLIPASQLTAETGAGRTSLPSTMSFFRLSPSSILLA
jgi:hypothetical protein